MVVFDWTISLGTVLIALGFVGTVLTVSTKLGRYMQKLDDFMEKQIEINEDRTTQIDKMNEELGKLNEIMIKLAATTSDINHISTRLNRNESVLDELRHWRGFVDPTIPQVHRPSGGGSSES